ncbi:MAG: TraB/GumN family protein [Sphingomonadaceae bacterium]|nr:TraB/GumN family protein [Sphingomonadaceae bacterium]
MTVFTRRLTCFLGTAALALTLPACAQQTQDVASASPAVVAATEAEPVREGPALWKVADEDTTIYLFGTIHALPKDVVWYKGTIAEAFAGSDMLVTEVMLDESNPGQMQQLLVGKAMLPPGQSLRDLLNEDQRAAYEKAMISINLPVAAFDRFEPWYAAMMLSMLPLLQQGYDPNSGVEKVLTSNAPAGMERGQLESIDYQLTLFDELPMESQISYLMEVAGGIDGIKPMIDQMVGEWVEGDARGLAELMNGSMGDPVLMEQLLLQRNRTWARWIDDRLDQPGVVFVAVGAGHLAGDDSVQEELADRGIVSIRVQ